MIKTNEAHDIDRLLGQKIRELRVKEGITQKELAGDKITRNMLSLIENGSASPSVRTLLYIADKLETPAGYFFSSNAEDESRFLKLRIAERRCRRRDIADSCGVLHENRYPRGRRA